jgi:membrane protein DedA with SNARE-associated domain
VPDIALIRELVGWLIFLTSAGFGNPIPEEVMLVSAGVRMAAMSDYGPWRWLIYPVVLTGGVLADVVLYTFGRVVGARLMEWRLFKWLAPPEKQEHIRNNFDRYGFAIFALGRLVPGIRTTLFLTSGMMRLSLVRFCLADGVGALFGGSLFFFLGYGLGAHFLELFAALEQRIAPYRAIIIITMLLAVAGYLLYVFLRHPIPTGDPEEVPLIGHQIAVHMPGQAHEDGAQEGSAAAQAPSESASQTRGG